MEPAWWKISIKIHTSVFREIVLRSSNSSYMFKMIDDVFFNKQVSYASYAYKSIR